MPQESKRSNRSGKAQTSSEQKATRERARAASGSSFEGIFEMEMNEADKRCSGNASGDRGHIWEARFSAMEPKKVIGETCKKCGLAVILKDV